MTKKILKKIQQMNFVYLKIHLLAQHSTFKNFIYQLPTTNKIYLHSARNNYIKMYQNVIDGELREAKLIAKYLIDHAGDLSELIYAANQVLKMRVLVSKESMLDHTDNGVVKEKSDIDLNQLLSEIEQETAQAKQEEEAKEATKTMPKSIEEAIRQEEQNSDSTETSNE